MKFATKAFVVSIWFQIVWPQWLHPFAFKTNCDPPSPVTSSPTACPRPRSATAYFQFDNNSCFEKNEEVAAPEELHVALDIYFFNPIVVQSSYAGVSEGSEPLNPL